MNKHPQNRKGSEAVLLVSSDLVRKGFFVAYILNESCPYDLIASIKGNCYRIQVKYKKKTKGYLEVDGRANGGKYKIKDFDVFGVYCPNTKECYYFPNNGGRRSYNIKTNLKLKFPIGEVVEKV